MKKNILHIFLTVLLLLVVILFILVINLYIKSKNISPQKEVVIIERSQPEAIKQPVAEEAIPETQAVYDKFSKYGIKPREAKYYEHE